MTNDNEVMNLSTNGRSENTISSSQFVTIDYKSELQILLITIFCGGIETANLRRCVLAFYIEVSIEFQYSRMKIAVILVALCFSEFNFAYEFFIF